MKYLLIENPTYTHKVKVSDITCIIAQEGRLRIETITDDEFFHCQTLKHLEKQLPDYFIRLCRNVLVNGIYLTGLDKATKTVLLENGRELPVSRRQMPFITKFIKRFVDEANKNSLKDIVKLFIG